MRIELSAAQVDQVLRAASDGGGLSVVLAGIKDARQALQAGSQHMQDARLSRSLIAGLLMLASFPTDGGDVGNGELARMVGMNQSTAHRYISTLVALGLVERDPGTRRYKLAQ